MRDRRPRGGGAGFDAFAEKWVPEPPPWSAERPAWRGEGSEDERLRAYRDEMERAGGEALAFRPELRDRVRRAVAEGTPIFALLDALLADPEVGSGEAASVFFQRVFGVPASRARYVASWRTSNRSPEAQRVLERVVRCAEDARRAGVWSPPAET